MQTRDTQQLWSACFEEISISHFTEGDWELARHDVCQNEASEDESKMGNLVAYNTGGRCYATEPPPEELITGQPSRTTDHHKQHVA